MVRTASRRALDGDYRGCCDPRHHRFALDEGGCITLRLRAMIDALNSLSWCGRGVVESALVPEQNRENHAGEESADPEPDPNGERRRNHSWSIGQTHGSALRLKQALETCQGAGNQNHG